MLTSRPLPCVAEGESSSRVLCRVGSASAPLLLLPKGDGPGRCRREGSIS